MALVRKLEHVDVIMFQLAFKCIFCAPEFVLLDSPVI
jgi:hypothetical protein